MRTLDFESPDDLRRIKLITDIVQNDSMSKRLEIVRQFEHDMKFYKKIRGRFLIYKHKKLSQTL